MRIRFFDNQTMEVNDSIVSDFNHYFVSDDKFVYNSKEDFIDLRTSYDSANVIRKAGFINDTSIYVVKTDNMYWLNKTAYIDIWIKEMNQWNLKQKNINVSQQQYDYNSEVILNNENSYTPLLSSCPQILIHDNNFALVFVHYNYLQKQGKTIGQFSQEIKLQNEKNKGLYIYEILNR